MQDSNTSVCHVYIYTLPTYTSMQYINMTCEHIHTDEQNLSPTVPGARDVSAKVFIDKSSLKLKAY